MATKTKTEWRDYVFGKRFRAHKAEIIRLHEEAEAFRNDAQRVLEEYRAQLRDVVAEKKQLAR